MVKMIVGIIAIIVFFMSMVGVLLFPGQFYLGMILLTIICMPFIDPRSPPP